MNTTTSARTAIEDLVRPGRSGHERPWLVMPWRWLGLARAARRVRARARQVVRPIRAALSRALSSLSDLASKPVRLITTVMRMIAKDRGFGFWWLAVTAAIALAVGMLVGLLLSPVIGIIAALIVGIWMLARRASSRKADTAAPLHGLASC
jgi:hypothetical protein